MEITRHYLLATDNNTFPITDKELYECLQKYKSELDLNTLSEEDLKKIIENPLYEESEDEWENDDPVY